MCTSCEWKPEKYRYYKTPTKHSITSQFPDTRYIFHQYCCPANATILFFISATAGVDYSSIPGRYTSGRLTLYYYSTRQCKSISTRADSLVEGTENFLVQLWSTGPLPPSVKLARTSATVFILDNDGT